MAVTDLWCGSEGWPNRASAIPSAKGSACLQMKLVYNHLGPTLLYLLQWMDCSCTCLLPIYLSLFHVLVYKVYAVGKPNISSHGRKATIRDFYAVILPSLQQLHGDLVEWDDSNVGFAWSPAPKWFCPTAIMNVYQLLTRMHAHVFPLPPRLPHRLSSILKYQKMQHYNPGALPMLPR